MAEITFSNTAAADAAPRPPRFEMRGVSKAFGATRAVTEIDWKKSVSGVQVGFTEVASFVRQMPPFTPLA